MWSVKFGLWFDDWHSDRASECHLPAGCNPSNHKPQTTSHKPLPSHGATL